MTSVTTECSGVQPNVTDPANLSAVVGSLSADAGDGLPVAGYDSPAKNVKNPSSGESHTIFGTFCKPSAIEKLNDFIMFL